MRIQQSTERLSPGTAPAYKFYAMSSTSGIADVAVYSSQPGTVTIVPLMSGGQVPAQEILDQVHVFCNDDKRRTLCDTIMVIAPTVVEYAIDVDYWIDKNSNTLAGNIEAAVIQS